MIKNYYQFNESLKDVNTKEDIIRLCKEYSIRFYKINDDLSIDITSNINLTHREFKNIPLNFNKINGSFDISENFIESLEGSPKYIEVNFICHNNSLTSFKHSPNFIGGVYDCSRNDIRSFKYFPENAPGKLLCIGNPIYVIWDLFRDESKIDLFNEYDPIRDEHTEPHILVDRLNDFLDSIKKPEISTKFGIYNLV